MKLRNVRTIKLVGLFFLTPLILFGQLKLHKSENHFLYDDIENDQVRVIEKVEDKVNFIINKKVVNEYKLSPRTNINFILSGDKSYFALLEYYFGSKNEISTINILVFENNFQSIYNKKLALQYEENIPLISIDNAGAVWLFSSTTSEIKKITKNSERSIFLEKNLVINMERRGFLVNGDEDIFVVLSGLDHKSEIFTFDKELNLINRTSIGYTNIHRAVISDNNSLLISAYNFESEFDPVLLRYEKKIISEIKNVLIEDRFGGSDKYIFSANQVYSLDGAQLIKRYSIPNGNIISGYFLDERFHLLIRLGTQVFYYNLSNEFEILSKFELNNDEHYLGFYFSVTGKKLFLKTKNSFLSLN
ncbi:MAG: hypothetical protein FJ213_03450 [Ignavibacteria bacterium]|nr:hypothetical protein [Ignavibacteria bacterium]